MAFRSQQKKRRKWGIGKIGEEKREGGEGERGIYICPLTKSLNGTNYSDYNDLRCFKQCSIKD